ncbi:hypothetical protein J4465_01265 [Candidatus Pacearchaeota archaeon]|nr:hypothetical protein [Candidatus Pacearchaeota archaeon]
MKNIHIAAAILGLLVISLLVSGAGCLKETGTTADAESLSSDMADLNDFSADLENLDIGTIDDSELTGLEDFAV